MSVLFISGIPNKNGNTAALAEVLLSGKEYGVHFYSIDSLIHLPMNRMSISTRIP